MDELVPRSHNNPPSLIEHSVQTVDDASDWLKNYPVIETEEATREAKVLFDRISDCLKDMEAEEKNRKKPLREQIDLIAGEYRSPRAIAEKIRLELMERLNAWRRKEEENRRMVAEKARKAAEEAEKLAREAEERERIAIEDAKVGAETDVGSATREADTKFRSFEQARRNVERAERATDVKISGGFRRALGSSRFEKKELVVTNPDKALAAMGWSERLLEALKSDARAYHRQSGKWPDGIKEEIQ